MRRRGGYRREIKWKTLLPYEKPYKRNENRLADAEWVMLQVVESKEVGCEYRKQAESDDSFKVSLFFKLKID